MPKDQRCMQTFVDCPYSAGGGCCTNNGGGPVDRCSSMATGCWFHSAGKIQRYTGTVKSTASAAGTKLLGETAASPCWEKHLPVGRSISLLGEASPCWEKHLPVGRSISLLGEASPCWEKNSTTSTPAFDVVRKYEVGQVVWDKPGVRCPSPPQRQHRAGAPAWWWCGPSPPIQH
eukprot:gene16354-biopygen3765